MVYLVCFQFFSIVWNPYYGMDGKDPTIVGMSENRQNTWLPGDPEFYSIELITLSGG